MSATDPSEARYELLQQKLASANASLEAAEVHGVICGLLVTGSELPESWFAEVFDQAEAGDLLVAEARGLVEEQLAQARRELAGDGLGLQLLLPDDDTAITLRAQALTEWCQGFLYGFALGSPRQQLLSEDAKEALETLSALTQMDVAALGEPGEEAEEEQSLVEISEFVRMATMLLRDHQPDMAAVNPDEADQSYKDSDTRGRHDYH